MHHTLLCLGMAALAIFPIVEFWCRKGKHQRNLSYLSLFLLLGVWSDYRWSRQWSALDTAEDLALLLFLETPCLRRSHTWCKLLFSPFSGIVTHRSRHWRWSTEYDTFRTRISQLAFHWTLWASSYRHGWFCPREPDTQMLFLIFRTSLCKSLRRGLVQVLLSWT